MMMMKMAAQSDDNATAAKQSKLGESRWLAVKSDTYDKPFPYFRKPSEVGSFSQDHKRTFHHDRRQLRYYVKPTAVDPCFDLRQGYRSFIRKDQSVKEHLDDMLRWVMVNREKFALHSDKKQSNTKAGLERYTVCKQLTFIVFIKKETVTLTSRGVYSEQQNTTNNKVTNWRKKRSTLSWSTHVSGKNTSNNL